MSSIKLKHSGGNGVIIAAPDSNPASDRTLKLPSNADGTILTTTSSDADRYKAGEVVQLVMGTFINYYSGTNFADITSTSYVNYGDMKLSITPKFTTSKLIFETDINSRLDDADGYVDYELYDTTNSRSLMSAGIQNHYNVSTTAYPTSHIRLFGDAGYTTAIELQVRVKITNGGTLNSDFTNNNRLMTITEVKQ